MLFAHLHAGSVLPLHPETRGVKQCWKGPVADMSLRTACTGGEGIPERVEGGVSPTAHTARSDDYDKP